MAVNEITKNFLVYAIRDFSFAVAAVTLFSNMFLLKKFIIQTFFTIQSKEEILSSLVLKNIPSISSKKTLFVSQKHLCSIQLQCVFLFNYIYKLNLHTSFTTPFSFTAS